VKTRNKKTKNKKKELFQGMLYLWH